MSHVPSAPADIVAEVNDALNALDTGEAETWAQVWVRGFQGRPQLLIMGMRLTPRRQGNLSDGVVIQSYSHRGDH